MKTNRKAAVLALGLALLSPLAGAALVDTEWWKVDFTSPTPEGTNELGAVVGDVELFDGDSVSVLTNTVVSTVGDVTYKPAYASGFWSMSDGDESVITNSVVTNALEGTSEESLHIKLDTQGNDLVWAPSNGVPDVINLVDADLLLVGSDSAPDHEDFDPTNATKRVQTAIFLKNATDEESGETTNSVLCVYSRNTTTLKNEWMELTGDVKIEDNSWHHVQVSIDYTGKSPVVVVKVDGKTMTPVSGGEITAANPTESKAAAKVQEVCFRGTGAVDNFVGTSRVVNPDSAWFEAKVFWDGTEMKEEDGWDNSTLIVKAGVGEDGKSEYAVFPDFLATDADFDYEEDPSWCLDRVELFDLTTPGTKRTFGYYWNDKSFKIAENEENEETSELDLREQGGWQTGMLLVKPCTDGAIVNETNLIAKIYFKTIGAFYANAVTEIGDNVATNGTLLKPVAAGGTYPTNLVWTFPATDGANVLTGVKVENGATATYDSATRVATATVTLATALETDKTFVTATYAEGSYEGKTPTWIDNGNGSYVLGNYVAKIDGEPDSFYETLAAAVEAVEADAATTTTITLLADIDLTGDNANVTIPADKDVTLDLNGHSIAGDNDADITVLGSFTFTDSAEYEEGDTPASLYATAAYATGHDTGLVRVSGSGVFTMAGGVIDAATIANPADNGQFGVVYIDHAVVNVTGGTIKAGWYALSSNGTVKDGTPFSTTVTISGGTLVSTSDYAIYMADAGTVTISEAEGSTTVVDGAAGAICTRRGSLDIQGGSFSTAGTGDVGSWSDGTGNLSPNVLINVPANYAQRFGDTACPVTISGGTFIAATGVDCLSLGNTTVGSIAVSGGSFSVVVPDAFCDAGYVPVTTPDPVTGLYTVGTGAVQITIAGEVKTFGSIADAQAAAAAAEIADPVFTIVDVLSEETVTLASGETLKILVGEDGDVTALTVETSETDTAQYAYAVADETDAETGVTTYSVVQTTKTYKIVFNVDQVAVLTTNAPYGDTLYGPATDPTKASSESTDFAFAGWTNVLAGGAAVATADLPAVTTNATWDAVFTESARKYTITWTMDDDSVIDTTTVAYGATPTHADPTKASTAEFSYEFAGWSPEVVEVTGEATYKATFTATTRSYAVTFLDGTEEEGDDPFYATNVLYGATLYGPAADPTKASTAEKDFTFAGWTNAAIDAAVVATADLPAVAGEATYTAVFTESARTYEIVFNDADGTPLATTNAPYGDTLYGPADPTKAADAQFTYAFAGWTNAAIDAAVVSAANLPAVDAAATYTAVYTATVNEYTITFSTNGVAYVTTDVAYGATEYGPADPARDGFTFDGWTNSVSGAFVAQGTTVFPAVSGTAEWTAVWTEDLVVQAIDPGNAMSAEEKAANPPVAVTSAGFTVHFKGVKGVTYSLLAAGSLDVTQSDWENPDADANSKVTVVQSVSITTDAQASEVQTLTATMTDSVKFFKIGARKTGN